MTETAASDTAASEAPVPALFFAFSLAYLPILALAAWFGGWALLAAPVTLWGGSTLLDWVLPASRRNPGLDTPAPRLVWHDILLLGWVPVQLALIFGTLWLACRTGRFDWAEDLSLMLCVGVATGTFGVTYAHELMHRSDTLHRTAADILMTSVLYGHFVTEHVKVHHRYVGTPRDPVTARYNESVYAFLWRVLPGSLLSAWRVEAERMRRRGKPVIGLDNPFWRYLGGAAAFLLLAWLVGGWKGVGLFAAQAAVAVVLTEFINYVQHYGLTRKHLGEGRYEPAAPWHSWNAIYPATSCMLINLQRHSDHHSKPARIYPLLQTYPKGVVPHLPFGYPGMVTIAVVPQVWRRVMNRRVKRWRERHYPEIQDWRPYSRMATPMPR